jgi:hypothetical protein
MNWIALIVVIATIGAGVYISINIDNSIGGINDYCRLNRRGFVDEYNCTVWNKYYVDNRVSCGVDYKIVEWCDQHNVTGWTDYKDMGMTGFASLGMVDCQQIRNFGTSVDELFI